MVPIAPGTSHSGVAVLLLLRAHRTRAVRYTSRVKLDRPSRTASRAQRPGRRAARRALAALVCLAAAACSSPETLPERLTRLEANCVVLVVDAAAAGHFASYGYERETTPRIDALAARSVLFERAYAQAPSTSPSVPSYLSGLYPHTLAKRLAEGRAAETHYLPEAFARAGFRTAGFSGNPIVELAIPGQAIFERFDGSAKRENIRAVPLPSRKVVKRALDWVDTVSSERFFLYVHLLPPHGPYTPPEKHRRFTPPEYAGDLVPTSWRLHAIDRGKLELTPDEAAFVVSQYDGNLDYADALVAQVLDGLAARGLLERSVVVVLSDHGEAFGQHGRWVHTSTLYEEMIRVPWIISLPPAAEVQPRRVQEAVALVDLAPTLRELFALEADEFSAGEGTSLATVLASATEEPVRRLLFSQNSQSVAAIEDGYKLILEERDGVLAQELYDVARDPDEARNLADEEPDRVEALRTAIGRFVSEGSEPLSVEEAARSLSEESTRQLNALGYLMPSDEEPTPVDSR